MESTKTIGCKIHGYIHISGMALRIIHTPEFQRLRNIMQLGLCHYVYPAATHTRFEHSLGVYHLTCKMTKVLRKKYPDKIYDIPDLGLTKLTEFVAELIKIAGLCHDLGHGPFSHIFDDMLKERDVASNPRIYHETRSCLIVEMICRRELSDVLTDAHIKFIQSIISPGPQHRGALYQIVANYLNGIDVDKFDYLARDPYTLGFKKGFDPRKIINEIAIDANDNIAYTKHCSIELYDMFQTRYMMHKQVYNHKGTKIIESMVRDILEAVDPIFHVFDSINDMGAFCKFTDQTVFSMIETAVNPPPHMTINLDLESESNIRLANQIYQQLTNRTLYKCVAEISNEGLDYLDKFLSVLEDKGIQTDRLELIKIQIGYVSSDKKHPFDSIYFYNNKKQDSLNTSSFIMNKKNISIIMCENYIETIQLLICKDLDLYATITAAYEQWTRDIREQSLKV